MSFRALPRAGQPFVALIDDDAAIRVSLHEVLQSVGVSAISFGSTEEMAAAQLKEAPDCLVIDVRLPGLSGLDYQKRTAETASSPPIILMSGHADIPMCVEAMKAGAIDFLIKPFRDQVFIDAVAAGLRLSLARRRALDEADALARRFAQLSPRERQVMILVTAGRMNKQVAGDLQISEVTTKLHRGAAMRKMGADSFAELVRMASLLGLSIEERRTPVSPSRLMPRC